MQTPASGRSFPFQVERLQILTNPVDDDRDARDHYAHERDDDDQNQERRKEAEDEEREEEKDIEEELRNADSDLLSKIPRISLWVRVGLH